MDNYLDLTPDFFQELISTTDPGVTITTIEVTTGAGRGDNYTSMLYRVRADGISDVKKTWTKSFICKFLPLNRARREAFKSETLFRNEVAFYTRALPALQMFQSSKGCSVFKEVPKVYLAKSHILVLEDLKEKGFKMADRKKALDIEHCEAILSTLGNFHGLSLAFKTLSPNAYNSEVASQVSECLFREEYESWYREYYKRAGKNAVEMLREHLSDSPQASRYISRFLKFIDDGFFCRMVTQIQTMTPLVVLSHGDCWTNNFLFQYNESGGINKLCMLDFQFARIGSPALDLAQLLFSCTNRSLRKSHMDHLLRTYTNSLQNTLNLLGCPTSPFGNDEILKVVRGEFRRCSTIGLGLAIDLIPICTCDSEQAPDLYIHDESSPESEQSVSNSSEACKLRMSDLIVEMVDSGLI